jgi:hypothetical protein
MESRRKRATRKRLVLKRRWNNVRWENVCRIRLTFFRNRCELSLSFFDTMDLSHQEIAESLGITVENVKVRLHRARTKLKAILEEECTFEVDERNVLVCDRIEIGLARGGSRVS